MSLEKVKEEIQKHDIQKFDPLPLGKEEVRLAVEYLKFINRKEMADYLAQLAQQGLLRVGPLEGFLAAATVLGEKDYILLSSKYDQYNTTKERLLSLVHEIVQTTSFKDHSDESKFFEFGASRWFDALEKEKSKAAPKAQPVTQPGLSVQTPPPVSAPAPAPTPPPAPSLSKGAKKSLFSELILRGLISKEQLNDAHDKQIGAKKSVQELLLEMGFLKEEDLLTVSVEVFGMPPTPLAKDKVDQAVLSIIPYELAAKHNILPLRKEDNTLILAMSHPQDLMALDDVRAVVELSIQPVYASVNEIKQCIDECYGGDDKVRELLNNSTEIEDVDVVEEVGRENKDELIKNMEKEGIKEDNIPELPPQYQALLKEESATVKLVNLLFSDAVKGRASDIHIEPREKTIEVRYRIDGDLKIIMAIPLKFHNQMVARIKILATLDITQHVEPQDGRIQLMISKRRIDFRVSTIPTIYGEKIVARILDGNSAKKDLTAVGLVGDDYTKFVEAIKTPQGMVFVTGPTGSGKTSTLYAGLNFIKGEKTNIVTVEDPIEFINEGINQVQVNPRRGITFAGALRSILRQDPNVILIGEIRDKETAEIAVQASLTGHLVLSTLHTNSAIETITRLVDIGLEYYQIASSVLMIVSQRLMKRLCVDCKEEYQPNENYKLKFKNEIEHARLTKFYQGKGCAKCNFTGYFGRVADFEILKINQHLRDMIAANASPEKLREEAKKTGMITLVEAGLKKVEEGVSTLDEVLKNLGTIEKGTEGVEQSTQDKVEEKKSRAKPLILAVDDEPDLLKILTKYLQLGGYDVIEAHNGQEAIEKTFKEKPDLIVTDLMMPVMNGLEETKILRSRLETAVIPIIMLTAKQDKESELQGLNAGADDYITKPFDKDKLLTRIKMLVKRK